MRSANAPPPTPRAAHLRVRLPFVDWARGAAYVLMVIAHVAPGDGPARILLVSEFLTAPLFALLVGVGAQLGWSASTSRGRRFVMKELFRAACVAALGVLLIQSDAQVLIVLLHLAVLMVLCLPLVRLRTGPLAAAGGIAVVLAVSVPGTYRRLLTEAVANGELEAHTSPLLGVLGAIGGTGSYRLTGFVLCAIIGMLAIRVLQSASEQAWLRGAGASLAAFAAMLALIVAPNLLGLFEVHAYDGTPAEQIGPAFGALGVLLAMWALQASPLGRSLPATATRMLAAPGQAALSLYALQVLVLNVYQVQNPTLRDDHWWMLALLLVLGLGAAIAWQAALRPIAARNPSARVWVRGPIEGVIGALQAPFADDRARSGAQQLASHTGPPPAP